MPTIAEMHAEATAAAELATKNFLQVHGNRDCCGFAWVTIYGVKLSTKEGKEFAKLGFKKEYGSSGIKLWNPSKHHTQCITAKEEGARAYADVFQKYGFRAYMGSRLD